MYSFFLAVNHEVQSFNWCAANSGLVKIFGIAKTFLNLIHIIVPIGLIMTAWDIFKKVINPDDKDGQKKILNRAISAIVVFFVPVLVSFVLKLVDVGMGNNESDTIKSDSCWRAWENA